MIFAEIDQMVMERELMADQVNGQERAALDLMLKCRGFRVDVAHDDLPVIRTEFILPIPPSETELIAEALKRLTQYLSTDIYLVKATGEGKRCFYCGVLADPEDLKCDSCGAPY